MINIIQKRLAAYEAANQLEEENAVKEILQDIALYGLWRSNFFDPAAFTVGLVSMGTNGTLRGHHT